MGGHQPGRGGGMELGQRDALKCQFQKTTKRLKRSLP